jgi:hypothetical protein
MGGKGSGRNHKATGELYEYEEQRNVLIPEAMRLSDQDMEMRSFTRGIMKKKQDRDHAWNSLYFWHMDHLFWMHEHPKP